MFRTLIYPSSGARDCVDELPHRSSGSQFVVCWSFCCGWYLVVFVLQAEAEKLSGLRRLPLYKLTVSHRVKKFPKLSRTRTRSGRLPGPTSLLYNGYRVSPGGNAASLPGVTQRGRGVNHPPPSRAEVKERVQPYLYSPSGSSWPVLWLTFLVCSKLRLHTEHILIFKGAAN